MKKTARLLLTLSLVLCVLLALPLNASAASMETQAGLKVTIATDKNEYSADEDILVSVNIENNNSYRVENISIETRLPEGMVLKRGNLSTENVGIDAGAFYASSIVARSFNLPQTGDDSNIVLWTVLFIASAIAAFLILKSKKTAKILGLFLCFAMVSTMLPVSSFAAENDNITITTDKTIVVDSKEYVIEAVVTRLKSEAEVYCETHGKLIDIIDVEDSADVLSEAEARAFLMSRGLGTNPITYDYSITGNRIGDTEVAENSAATHPMYRTLYLSKTGDAWAIYIINGSCFANPLSFNLESNLPAELLVSETETLTSYDDATDKFFVTIPYESTVNLQTVNRIDTETLDKLTIEELCNLSGATVSMTTNAYSDESQSSAMLLSNNIYASRAALPDSRYSSENPLIVVSLGDSYSSGEGIEPFYGQDLPLESKVKNFDWLAHRSQQSWPSQLEVPGVVGTMADYKMPLPGTSEDDEDEFLGPTSYSNCRWYFAAASGATTDHIQNWHDKPYSIDRYDMHPLEGMEPLPPQVNVFSGLQGDVDYVTLSIGGNDVEFKKIVETCVINCANLHLGATSALEDQLNRIWAGIGTVESNIKTAYEDIRDAAGPQAAIIVVGYPQLFEPNGEGYVINKTEAQLVNKRVSEFNDIIEAIVGECSDAGMDIYFVDVEDDFLGHAAGSNNPWLHGIILTIQTEDLEQKGVGSAYSVHPTIAGAQKYAELVNDQIEKIEEKRIEAERAVHDITGIISIADTDMDMTNNIPLEGALVSLEYTGYMSKTDYTNSAGEYTIQEIPVGTYKITVSKDGYIPVTETIHVSENDAEVIFNIAIEAISEEHSGVGYASGQIFDVGTGRPVSGMTLYVRAGLENTTGTVISTLHMNDSTTYSTTFGLEAGNYTIQIVDERTGISENERYVTSHFNIKILGGMTIDNQNGYVSNGLVSEELRVVLTWGSTPSDLDSHMVGPDGVGGKFHEYYTERNDGSDTDLDVDDTSSYGPETITVYQEYDGTYVYAVHDYTNNSSSSSNALSNSGAQVNVYRDNQLIMTYNVPRNQGGTLWTVFAYDSRTRKLTTINEMSYDASYGDGVLMTAEVRGSGQSELGYDEYISIMVADIFSNTKEKD